MSKNKKSNTHQPTQKQIAHLTPKIQKKNEILFKYLKSKSAITKTYNKQKEIHILQTPTALLY